MLITPIIRTVLLAAVVGLMLAACGESTTRTTSDDGMDMDEMFGFGEPAEAADADRSIEIIANDDFSFDPNEITVTAGETINFRVSNPGELIHDFTVGDQATQDAHDGEMAEMAESGEMIMHDEANAIAIRAGETKELTWQFTEPGRVLIGCHQPGHYASGMKGAITVES